MALQYSAAIGPIQASSTRIKSKSNPINWPKLMAKLAIWAASELLLGWAGLDNLADYGEFVLGDWGQGAEAALYQVQPKPQAGLGLRF